MSVESQSDYRSALKEIMEFMKTKGWDGALSITARDFKPSQYGEVNCLQCGKSIPYHKGTCHHCGYKEF